MMMQLYTDWNEFRVPEMNQLAVHLKQDYISEIFF